MKSYEMGNHHNTRQDKHGAHRRTPDHFLEGCSTNQTVRQ
ncbi:Unknown protein sequence [Pseudomonas amygdali pv. lachrymans]|uniref:Uncharacterized protein n=1 Tax=Pseudomonas amygdali pv. lachrymans TaxID=53707 RepID=A0ABR5KSW4_PSEAV|nr:Unknown protein sequence [Pseudomonas amygdali pv. lachrymans]